MGDLESRLTALEKEMALIEQSLKAQSRVLNEIKNTVTKDAVIMEKLKTVTVETENNRKSIDCIYKTGTVKCMTTEGKVDSLEKSIGWLKKVGAGIIVMIVTQFFGIIAYAIEHFRR